MIYRIVKTINQVAKDYKVSPLTVRRWIIKGQIHAVKFGGNWRLRTGTFDVEDMPLICTVNDVAKATQCSELTVRRMISRGQLPATKVNRRWQIARTDLRKLLP